MRKIFFSDLDGTLLNDEKQITPATRKALDAWMDAGNIFVFSSGRPTGSVKQVATAEKMNHENFYIVGFNGSEIFHPASGKTLLHKALSIEDATRVFEIATKLGVYVHAYNQNDQILIPREGEEIDFYHRSIHLESVVLPDYPLGLTEGPTKCLGINLENQGKLESLAEAIQAEMGDRICCLKSNPFLLEIFNKSAGKGQAVKDMAEMFHVSLHNTLAAGDEQNDISMLEAAGTGIAMCNGNPIVKASADVVTTLDNNHDGLLPWVT
ncbi:MAG: Cof-type HAD-IIB family hydrolase [Lachnospiraceae bacterium]|nr:Cof-type HAD-IIB family hydrolase [Lachnospiraceae bacterium]